MVYRFHFGCIKKHNFIYLFIFGCAGSSLLCGLSLALGSGGPSPAAKVGLLTAMASLALEHGLQGTQASVVAGQGLGSLSSQAGQHRLDGCGTWA